MIFYTILLVFNCFLFSLNTFLQGARKQIISIVLSWLIIAINCSSIYFFSIKFFLLSVVITFITLWIGGVPARYIASKILGFTPPIPNAKSDDEMILDLLEEKQEEWGHTEEEEREEYNKLIEIQKKEHLSPMENMRLNILKRKIEFYDSE